MQKSNHMKVLIIDDDDIIRAVLSDTLVEAGFETCQLPSPIGATKKIIHEGVNVVVLDVMMPEVSGDKLAKMLRGNAKMGRVGIVLVSSLKANELRRLQTESGADAVVEKERMHEDLVPAVRKASRHMS
jgi:DNA-binding response OmpR family regulator